MSCNIKRNKEGNYIVRADNGQPSILFKHLKATLGNDRLALEKWASTKTPEFNSLFPVQSSYVDQNGEHSMLYVDPKNDFLYYGKKDQASSAKAKDKIMTEDSLNKSREDIKEQSEILKATILKQIGIFRNASSSGARTNRYSDIARDMASTLNNNESAVDAIINFANYGSYYLKQAKEKLDQLKKEQDTNGHLEALNELGQLLIIFNNLKQFRELTGEYEKSFFETQMNAFFDEYGFTPDRKTFNAVRYYSSSPVKNIFKIEKFVTDSVGRLKNVTEAEKALVIKQFKDMVSNQDNLTSILDDILNKRDALASQLKNDYYATITEWLWPYVEETQEKVSPDLRITKKDFKNVLQRAKQDAGIGEYSLASLSTIDDPIAQTIRLAAEQARQDAHLATVANMSSLSKAKKAQFGDKDLQPEDYNKYLKTIKRDVKTVDEDGNEVYKTISTKALITEFRTDTLEDDRNNERKKQIDYFNQIEDEKIAKLQEMIDRGGMTDKGREKALNRLSQAKEDKDYNVRKSVQKAMNAWYETKYDIIKYKDDLIIQKKKELSPDDFKLWYSSNVYRNTIPADQLEFHKKNKRHLRMVHPDNLEDLETGIKNSSYYKEGRKDTSTGKVMEYYVYETFYGGEFTVPKAEYIDPTYASLANDKFFKELSRVYNQSNDSLDSKHKLKHGIIPQIEKGSEFWKGDLTPNENVRKMWGNMTPDIYSDENYHEIEQDGIMMKVSKANAQNVDGTQIKTIPVKFVSWLDDVENLDTNLIETFVKFNAVTNRHKEMSKTEASVTALKNIIVGNPELGISAREIILTGGDGSPAVTQIKNAGNKLLEYAVKEKGKRLNSLIVDFIDDIWYGDIEEKADIQVLGKNISLNKLSNFTSKWVSIQRLAGNLDSAISNLVIGKLAIFNEALAGKFYTMSEYYEASKIINQELFDGTVIKDYMQTDINEKSLYAQMMIRHDAIQGEFSNEYGIKMSKKTALEMSKDFLFFSQNGMEYTIQKRSMLCVSKGFKVQLPDNIVYDREANEGQGALRNATSSELDAIKQNKASIEEKYKALLDKQIEALRLEESKKPVTKEEIAKVAANISKMNKDLENISARKEDELNKTSTNYFTALDAYTQDSDGAIMVKDFLKPYFTNKVENQLRRRIQELNKRQQGIYAQFDKSQAQRHWLGKLALMFRKYLYSAYEHRFGDRKANLALGEETYGYQRQFINKFMVDFKTYGAWAFTKLMDGSATSAEQYAINKTLIEYATWASFMVLFWLLRSMSDDDDEDSWAFSKTAYIVKRTEDSLSEFALPFGIGTMVRTFKNPFAQMALVEQIYEVFAVIFDDPMNFGGVYERDSGLNEKGDSKFLGKLFKVVPVLRQYAKFMTPEDQLKFYTQKKTNV